MSKNAPHGYAHSEALRAASRASAGPTVAYALRDSPMPCEVLLTRLFRLTRAEARLARLLSNGETLQEAAAALNIRMSTARTQLSAVFASPVWYSDGGSGDCRSRTQSISSPRVRGRKHPPKLGSI